MFPGAVHGRSTAKTAHALQDLIRLSCRDIIKVQRDQVTPFHVGCLSPVPRKGSSDKSADILQLILL